jgi:hypothetical protein
MAMKILAQNLTEILLGRSVGRPIVIRQIEVSHTSIESAANYPRPVSKTLVPPTFCHSPTEIGGKTILDRPDRLK